MYAKFWCIWGQYIQINLVLLHPVHTLLLKNRGEKGETSPKMMLCLGLPRQMWVTKWKGAVPMRAEGKRFLPYTIKKRCILQQKGFTGITSLQITWLLCLQTWKDLFIVETQAPLTSLFIILACMFHIYTIGLKQKWMRECEKALYAFPDASWKRLSHKNWYFKHYRSLDMSVNIDRNLSAEIMSQLWPRIYKATFHSFIKKHNNNDPR